MKPEKWPTKDKEFAKRPGRWWVVRSEADKRGRKQEVRGQGDEFDELVVGHWIHLERMDNRVWWMRLGQVDLWITIERNGEVGVLVQAGEKELEFKK